VLGDHVSQKGSLQDAERTRFDISHPSGVTAEEIEQVEVIVNSEIQQNTDVVTRVMGIDEARESGAMALFGEKYDDEVRVVSMGRDNFSVELCGGTHVTKTGEIERFKITSEGALSSGIRRLEAVTGARVAAYEEQKLNEQQGVLDRLNEQNNALRFDLAALGGDTGDDASETEAALIKDNKRLQKEISELRRKTATEQGADDEVKDINGIKFSGRVLDGFPARDLKPMADDIKAQIGSGVVALISTDGGKASIVVGVTDDLTDKISAVDLVRVGSAALGGKGGGGRPDMAQAGGPDASAADAAITALEEKLAG